MSIKLNHYNNCVITPLFNTTKEALTKHDRMIGCMFICYLVRCLYCVL